MNRRTLKEILETPIEKANGGTETLATRLDTYTTLACFQLMAKYPDIDRNVVHMESVRVRHLFAEIRNLAKANEAPAPVNAEPFTVTWEHDCMYRKVNADRQARAMQAEAQTRRLTEQNAELLAACVAFEKLVADIVLNADWGNSLPTFTQSQIDAIPQLNLQVRNAIANATAATEPQDNLTHFDGSLRGYAKPHEGHNQSRAERTPSQ